MKFEKNKFQERGNQLTSGLMLIAMQLSAFLAWGMLSGPVWAN